MKKTKSIGLTALFVFGVTACIEFRDDIDGGRYVEIQLTAPVADAATGARSRFGMIIRDSKNEPQSLKVYARIDEGKKLRCALDPTPTNTIDETVDETIFWCPINTTELANGAHSITYWVVNRDGETASEQSVGFTHDSVPPELHAQVAAEGDSTSLTWNAGDPREFNEMTVTMNGVRLFTSFASKGLALLDVNLVRAGMQLEIRAFDKQRNASAQTITVP